MSNSTSPSSQTYQTPHSQAPDNRKATDGTSSQFPTHDKPRVWFITSGASPIGLALARQLLDHGDDIVLGMRGRGQDDEGRREELKGLMGPGDTRERMKQCRIVVFDTRSVSECQTAVAEAIQAFGRIDILFCCESEALIGTVEELAQTTYIQALVIDQFATNFFGPVNVVKAILPTLRSQRSGHIILLSGITGHLGTPGLGMYCASQWAIEGYVDSLAYEIAPFNLRASIVQSNIEVIVLTNKIVVVPPISAYLPPQNMAPLSRGYLGRVLDRLDEVTAIGDDSYAEGEDNELKTKPSTLLNPSTASTSFHPVLPSGFKRNLLEETVHAITAIGGHENPPARHIVGYEGVASVKEKLRTVSEELEDFAEVSGAVDL